MIRYDPYKLYCGISSSLTLGRPIMHYKDDNAFHSMRSYLNKPLNRVENDHEQMTSMWFVDRVIKIRQNQECDPLHENKQADGTIDGLYDQAEGWWLRAKQRYP